jgi:hypothetical protein
MTTYKLTDWDVEEDLCTVIGIHSTLEPYRMAYLINKYLKTSFKRRSNDHDVSTNDTTANFPVYEYRDHQENTRLYLVPNIHYGQLKTVASSGGLFDTEINNTVKTTLIKEHKNVDFLLKIEKDPLCYPVKKMLATLIEIPQVISTYQIDNLTIKNTDYLIFE